MCFVQGTLPSLKIPCQAPKSLKPEHEDLEPTHDAALSLINKLTSVWMLLKHVVVIHIPSKTGVKWINVCLPAKRSYIFAFFRQAEASAKWAWGVSHAQGDQEPCAWLTLRVIRLALASVRLRHTHTQITPVLQANGLLKASPIFVRFKIVFISLRYILDNFYFIHCVSFFIYLKSSFL